MLIAVLLSSFAQAQKISVSRFVLAESDLTAQNKNTMLEDQNGDKCALIRVQTTQKGFSFDVGSAGIQKVEDNHVGEIWVYVPFGVRHISIRHPQLGTLSNYNFPINIQRARTYEMVLTTAQVQTIVQQDLGGAYLVMTVKPANAIVYIDEVEQTVENCIMSKFLSYGKHSYRVAASLYQSEAGNVEMGRAKQNMEVNLKPAYGQLEICTTPENGAKVYIDNNETAAGTTPFTTRKLAGGSHTLLLQLSQYESQRMSVDVPFDGSTKKLTVPMSANFGTLTITSSQGSHIFVDDEDKGLSPWTGRLSAGPHVVEARCASHRPTSQRVDVVRGEKQSIEIAAPTPIYGSLNVSSKPVGADVFVDGIKVGTTPDVFTNILVGNHKLEMKKDGYQDFSENITIQENTTFRLEDKELKKGLGDKEQKKGLGDRATFTVNGVSFEMIKVEAGTFTMGATPEMQAPDSDEKPTHQVTLTNNYYMGKTEVTQSLWKAVMGSSPSYFKGDSKPVESVSWNDCQTFISKLNMATGKDFRLPTEAEWEFAARGGNKSRHYQYSGSNVLENVAWYDDNSGRTTHAVATKQPNELGLYDMSGNVWEWCQDRYGNYSFESQTNPTGAYSGSSRVIRGGSWGSSAWYCRSSNRFNFDPDYWNYYLGFRLALSE